MAKGELGFNRPEQTAVCVAMSRWWHLDPQPIRPRGFGVRVPDWELRLSDGRRVGLEVTRRQPCEGNRCVRGCRDHSYPTVDIGGEHITVRTTAFGHVGYKTLRADLWRVVETKGGPRGQLAGGAYDLAVLCLYVSDSERSGYELNNLRRFSDLEYLNQEVSFHAGAAGMTRCGFTPLTVERHFHI